ncbi:hornerin-like isoform X2 [Thrips palmi]|nr:hornerin-like isoform X2 [Thrips palmi]
MAPIKESAVVLLLSVSLMLGLATAYPHRGYHDEGDVQAPEKNVRHIDGLGVQQAAGSSSQLEEAMRQMQEQVKSAGGTGSGRWSVRYSEYSSGSGGEAGSSGAPIRATITGEALEGGDGVLGVATNCHNCRMRIRKVGGGASAAEYAGEQSGAGVQGVQQVQSSQSSQRYYSSRAQGGQAGQGAYVAGQGAYGGVRSDAALGGSGASSSRVVQSSRVVESAGYGGAASRPEFTGVDAAGTDGISGSSRKDTRVTKSSWQLSDLGYGTSNIEDIISRLDSDMRAGRFQNGKTVTTVTTTTSENGSPPVTRQETFVKDGVVDVAALPVPGAPDLGLGRPFTIGHSEVEDLLKGLREDLRSGKTQAGKTVTTVVESSSVNGGPPVVKKNTYVRDGFDASALETLGEDAARLGLGAGQLDLGQSTGGGSRSVSRTTHSSWSSGGRAPQHVDHLGGGNLLTNTHSRNVTSVSSYSSEGSSGSGDHLVDGGLKGTRRVDALGGGHLIRDSGSAGGYGSATYSSGSSTLKETRRVDALGGGHLIRDTDGASSQSSQYGAGTQSSQYGSSSSRYGASSYGAASSGSEFKGTRRVDALGGGHLLRETDTYGQPTQETMSVSQMPGYRKEDVPVDAGVPTYGGTSKYYSTFQSGGSGGYASGAAGQQAGVADGAAVSSDGSSRTSSSSTYKKVVTYSSSGSTSGSSGLNEERDVDRLGGGHLIRGVPGDVQRAQTDVGGNAAFIAAEQSGGRIPEASGSYFSSSSSSYQRVAGSGVSGVNPAAPTGTVVVPVRGTSSSGTVSGTGSAYGSRTEWADVQETRDDEFPPLGPATPATPSIKLGYGTGNGGYGGPPAPAASPDAPRGGKLTVSLMDIGILPAGSSGSTQQQVSQTSDSGYGAGGAGYSSGSSGYNSASGYSSSSRYQSSSSHGASGSGYGATGSGYGATGSGFGSSVSGHDSGSRAYSRQYASSAPVSSHSASWSSHSTYSSGTPGSSFGSSYGSEGVKGQRMTRGQQAPDCDGTA